LEDSGANHSPVDSPLLVLAGGAIATPRLLHRSDIRPRALGRGLSFHGLLFGQVVLEPGLCPTASTLNIAPRLWIPPTVDSPWHIQLLRDTCPLPASETVDNPHRLLEIQAFVPMGFRDDNVFLISEAGSDQFRFSFSDKDRERMRAMEGEVRRLASELGPWRRGCELTWLPHGAAHLVGTCAMDADDRRGVTDPQGRVHGFDNLYLATLGLIPTPVAVNPTLTAVALALGACDAILS
jgi:choline dehydrogenase-like flavoprotein